MKRLLAIAIATVAALTGTVNAASDEGSELGTAAILVLNADVCENKMSPMLTDLKTALVDKVSKKELTIVGAVVINGWKTKSDNAQWCSTANKNLKKMEKKYNDYIAAGN